MKFRINKKFIPIDVYPLLFAVGAGVSAGTFMISKSLRKSDVEWRRKAINSEPYRVIEKK